ncbi:MAG: hypothetical protein P8X57_08550, partial [Cyclobacteriaceae bacterium]
MNLVLYIRIDKQQIVFQESLVNTFVKKGQTFFDLDNLSGPEVVSVACEAVRRTDRGVVYLDIRETGASVEKLFPLLKIIHSRKNNFKWLVSGEHPGL